MKRLNIDYVSCEMDGSNFWKFLIYLSIYFYCTFYLDMFPKFFAFEIDGSIFFGSLFYPAYEMFYEHQASKLDYQHSRINNRDDQIEAMDRLKEKVKQQHFSGQ